MDSEIEELRARSTRQAAEIVQLRGALESVRLYAERQTEAYADDLGLEGHARAWRHVAGVAARGLDEAGGAADG